MAQHELGHPLAPDKTPGPCGFEKKSPSSWLSCMKATFKI